MLSFTPRAAASAGSPAQGFLSMTLPTNLKSDNPSCFQFFQAINKEMGSEVEETLILEEKVVARIVVCASSLGPLLPDRSWPIYSSSFTAECASRVISTICGLDAFGSALDDAAWSPGRIAASFAALAKRSLSQLVIRDADVIRFDPARLTGLPEPSRTFASITADCVADNARSLLAFGLTLFLMPPDAAVLNGQRPDGAPDAAETARLDGVLTSYAGPLAAIENFSKNNLAKFLREAAGAIICLSFCSSSVDAQWAVSTVSRFQTAPAAVFAENLPRAVLAFPNLCRLLQVTSNSVASALLPQLVALHTKTKSSIELLSLVGLTALELAVGDMPSTDFSTTCLHLGASADTDTASKSASTKRLIADPLYVEFSESYKDQKPQDLVGAAISTGLVVVRVILQSGLPTTVAKQDVVLAPLHAVAKARSSIHDAAKQLMFDQVRFPELGTVRAGAGAGRPRHGAAQRLLQD